MQIIRIIHVKFITARLLLSMVNRHQPFIIGINATLRISRNLLCHAVQGNRILHSCQLLIHITEIKEHLHNLRNGSILHALLESLNINLIKALSYSCPQHTRIVFSTVLIHQMLVGLHTLPEFCRQIRFTFCILQNLIKGILKLSNNILIQLGCCLCLLLHQLSNLRHPVLTVCFSCRKKILLRITLFFKLA